MATVKLEDSVLHVLIVVYWQRKQIALMYLYMINARLPLKNIETFSAK